MTLDRRFGIFRQVELRKPSSERKIEELEKQGLTTTRKTLKSTELSKEFARYFRGRFTFNQYFWTFQNEEKI